VQIVRLVEQVPRAGAIELAVVSVDGEQINERSVVVLRSDANGLVPALVR